MCLPDPISSMLKQIVLDQGAAVAGIADLALWVDPPGKPIAAMVFGLRYSDEIVEALPEAFGEDIWEPMSRSFSEKALDLYARLEDCLHSFCPSARSCRVDKAQEVLGVTIKELSQKAIAVLAGIGWMGKSSLLVHPTWGPRLRLGVLLTDAAITPDPPFHDNHCGDCRICVDACPVQAITNTGSLVKEFTTFSIEVKRCLDHIGRYVAQTGRRHTCGICLKVCPFGTKSGRSDWEDRVCS